MVRRGNDDRSLNLSLVKFFANGLLTSLADPRQALFFWRTMNAQRRAARVRGAWRRRGVGVPPILIVSVTHRCNLGCAGCFARAQHRQPERELSQEKLRDVVAQASELGVSFVVLAGGEPLLRPFVADLAAEFPDIFFLLFTNGLLIDENLAPRFGQVRNLVPLISIEGCEAQTDGRRGAGVHARLEQAMGLLARERVFFGASLTVTRSTHALVTDREYVQRLFDAGCRLFLYVDYTPVVAGTEDWEVTPTQREAMPSLMDELREEFGALFVAVPGDEAPFGGCLAAGRGFVHVSPSGHVEPCPFVPYSDVSLRDVPLREALGSEFLRRIRERPEELVESGGGCSLWQHRDWLQSVLASAPARQRDMAG